VVEVELVTERIVLKPRRAGTANRFSVVLHPAGKVLQFGSAAAVPSVLNYGLRPFSGTPDAVPALAPPVVRIPVHRIRLGIRSLDLMKPRGAKE